MLRLDGPAKLEAFRIVGANSRKLDCAASIAIPAACEKVGKPGRLAPSFDGMASSLEAQNPQVALANRAAKVLSAWNPAAIAPRDQQSVIEEMCRAIVEIGGYHCAWVGLALSDENKTVQPAACWGLEPQSIASLGITWAYTPRGQGPAGTAIRRGTAVIVNDWMTNPDIVPWRGKALRYHFNSVIALPLTVDDTVIGALTIHAAETGSFGAVEAMLLTEVVAALASGIVTVRSRSGRTRLGASLQRNEERFRAAAEASPDGLFLFEGTRRGLSGRTS